MSLYTLNEGATTRYLCLLGLLIRKYPSILHYSSFCLFGLSFLKKKKWTGGPFFAHHYFLSLLSIVSIASPHSPHSPSPPSLLPTQTHLVQHCPMWQMLIWHWKGYVLIVHPQLWQWMPLSESLSLSAHSLLTVAETLRWAHLLAFCLDEMQPISVSHSAQRLSETTRGMKATTAHWGQQFNQIASSLRFVTHGSLL